MLKDCYLCGDFADPLEFDKDGFITVNNPRLHHIDGHTVVQSGVGVYDFSKSIKVNKDNIMLYYTQYYIGGKFHNRLD